MMNYKDSCRHSGLRIKWTKEKVLIEAKKYTYRSDFERQAAGAWKSAKVNGWYEECVAHMKVNKDHYKHKLPTRWTIDEIYKELEKIKSWKEIYQNKQGMLQAIKRYGLTDEIKKRFNTRIAKFTYEELKEEALKYSNKQDFRKNQESMLRTIYERGLHHELLAHMNREGKEVFFQVERLLLHPKVKKIFEQLKIHFLYEKKYIIDNHFIIPDFVYYRDNTIYIIEVKTSYRKLRQVHIDDQILQQTEIIQKLNPDNKIVHILLSEYGIIQSLKSTYSMSLDEFKIFLDTGEYIYQEKIYKEPKELANQIEQEFINKFMTNVDRQED